MAATDERALDTPRLATVLDSKSSVETAHSRNTFNPWRSGLSEPYHFPLPHDGNPWGDCFSLGTSYDDEMCKAWREEVDTLLVFAGLFSAVVTAFTIESYRWLKSDSGDRTNLLLQQVLEHLSNVNDTMPQPPASNPCDTSQGSPASIRINILWFTSLTLALTSVLVGILCKQWLREYQRYGSLSPQDAFPLRQMRYEGLNEWHVPQILSSLPLLLQAAFVLFFVGLLDLLWSLNPIVASAASVVVGLALTLLIATTVLPTLQYLLHFTHPSPNGELPGQCAYKSPQSWAFHLLCTRLSSLIFKLQRLMFGQSTAATLAYLQSPLWAPATDWLKYDSRWQMHGTYTERGLEWIIRTFRRNVGAIKSVHHCLEHCLENRDNETAARFVAKRLADTLDPMVPLRDMLLYTLGYHETLDRDEPVYSTAKDLILMSYLLMHQTRDEVLAMRCIEQCVRIGNSEADIPNATDIVLEVLSIMPSWLSRDDDLRAQILAMLKNLLTRDRITSSNIANFWAIFEYLSTHGVDFSDTDSTLEASAAACGRDISNWLQRTMAADISVDEKIALVKPCLEGFRSIYQDGSRKPLSMEESSITVGNTPNPWPTPEIQAVLAMVKTLDEELAALPVNRPLTSPWSRDSWEHTKRDFVHAVGQIPDFELPSSRPCSPSS